MKIKKQYWPPGIIAPVPNNICSICAASFDNPCDLARHEIVSHKSHHCTKCPVLVFNSRNELKLHEERIHNKDDELLFKCYLCPGPRYFPKLSSLEEHIIDIHVVDKEFHCKACPKSFVTEADLEDHSRHGHTEVTEKTSNKHSCFCCSKTFNLVSRLKRHLSRDHGEVLTCFLCFGIFPSREELERHRRTDERLTCRDELCSYTFESQCVASQHYSNFHAESNGKNKEDSTTESETLNSRKTPSPAFQTPADKNVKLLSHPLIKKVPIRQHCNASTLKRKCY